jgi:hypothetical protein
MQSLARFSYLVLSVLILAGLFLMALLSANNMPWLLAVIGSAVGLIIIWVAVRRGESPPNPEKRLRRALGSGRPLVLHFYSDFDLYSMYLRLATAAAEKQYRGRVDFIHVSQIDPAGVDLAEKYQARLGSFILFDAAGREVDRVRRVETQQLAALMERPAR